MVERKVKRDGTISCAGFTWHNPNSQEILPHTWVRVSHRKGSGILIVTGGHGPAQITEEWVQKH